jgi:hypothetical protein
MSGEHINLVCTNIRMVSDDTELMLDCGWAEDRGFIESYLET